LELGSFEGGELSPLVMRPRTSDALRLRLARPAPATSDDVGAVLFRLKIKVF